MNNDEKVVRVQLHGALDGVHRVLIAPLAAADTYVSLAEKLKEQDPDKYGLIRVWKSDPNQISFLFEARSGTD